MRKTKYRKLGGNVKFEPKKWREALSASCYCYAIDVKSENFILVGEFIGKKCNEKVSDEELIRILKEELEFLDYEPKEVEVDYKTKPGEFKIYLERDFHSGYYHFYREDEDGTWSDKRPEELPKKQPMFLDEIKNRKVSVYSPSGWCFKLKEKEGAVK